MKTDGSEVYRLFLSGRRDPAMVPDPELLERLGPISDIVDETQPDLPWEEWAARPSHDIMARLCAALSAEEGAEDAALRRKALTYAAEALLSTVKRPGEEVLR